jgi:ABC-2 type transport system ATP-binding protein
MVEVEGVTKNFGEITAVNNVSFKMEKGEILGLLGPNAAGKTTLMRVITGFLPATSGTVRVAGYDVFNDAMEVKRRVGYLPEVPPLYPDMTVAAYLKFVAELKGVPGKQRRGKVGEVMEMTSIEKISGRLIDNISKGYRQRVGLAQALVNDPDVLILDEPTVGLDPEQIIEIRELIKRLGKSHTIMLSSHILPEVSAICDRMVILKAGRVMAVDTQVALQKRFGGEGALTVEILGPEEKIADELAKINDVEKVELKEMNGNGAMKYFVKVKGGADARADVFDCAVANNWKLLGMSRGEVSLEQLFLKLTSGDASADEREVMEGKDDE